MRELLEAHGEFVVIGEAADGEEALRLARELRPDLLLVDIQMPGPDGLQVAEELNQELPETRIVVLTGHDSPQYARTAARIGVSGYLSKTMCFADLTSTLLSIHRGQVSLPAAALRALRSSGEGAEGTPPSDREQQVLDLVATGSSNRDVADQLGISEATVQFHMRRLFAKLHARSRTELVHLARKRGWLS